VLFLYKYFYFIENVVQKAYNIIMNEKIGLLGAGGQSSETESYLTTDKVQFKAVDKGYIENENEIDITDPTDSEELLPVVASVGAPAARKDMVEKWPGRNYATVVSSEAYVGVDTIIGEGSIIAPRAVITTGVEIGRHSIINIATTLSHGDKIGDFVTISPGAHLGGDVVVGDGVFIGIGAIISNGLVIAEGSVIGAGAVVIESILQKNSVVVGVPARVVKVNEEWLRNV
jgi:acetyltransferase EpsM